MAHTKLISAKEAEELLKAGHAVRSGSDEHRTIMAALWEKVSRRFVYVVSAQSWFYRESGADRTPIREQAVQKVIDLQYHSDKQVLSYGRADGKVRAAFEAPQLSEVTNAHLELTLEKHRKPTRNSKPLLHSMVVDFMDTYPGQDHIVTLSDGSRVWNLWSKPHVLPTGPERYREPLWFLEVIERFFGDHKTEKDYFLDWCTHIVCRPEIKMPVSVLLVSSLNGAGKGFIAEALKHMVGARNYKNITSAAVKGGFQTFVMGTTLAVINELYEQGDYSFADKLKTWQSEESQFINIKYGPQQNTKNMVHFLAFSNRSSPINLDEGDRRWFTFSSDQKEPMPPEWWRERWRFLKSPETGLPHMGALGSLMRWFEERMREIERTRRFEPHGRPPETDHKRTLIEDSRSQFYHQVKALIDGGQVPIAVPREGLTTLAKIEEGFELGYRAPPNAQKTQDLEAFGFTRVKRRDGRFWAVPVGYEPIDLDT